jgi:hypothetical protein
MRAAIYACIGSVLLDVLALDCAVPTAQPPLPPPQPTPLTYMLNGRRVVTEECFEKWPALHPRGTSPEQQKAITECHQERGSCDVVCDPHPELLPPPKRVVYRQCLSAGMRVLQVTGEKREEVSQCWNDPDCELRCQDYFKALEHHLLEHGSLPEGFEEKREKE